MAVRIIAIGKKHEPWIAAGLERYQARLKPPYDVEWILLPHSSLEGAQARVQESARIAERLKDNDHVVLLDETGSNISSPELADRLDRQFAHSPVTLVIGGAFGVTPELRQRADFVWSLSRLVFPHQLVRLLLVEQLYRAQAIKNGSNYHHE